MLLISMFVIERRTIERPNFNAFPGSRLKNMTFSLLILAAVCLSSLLHDLSYRELTDRSFMLNNKFATTASALDLYDLSEAQQGDAKCSPTVIRITHRATLAADRERPQIIISGAIHGDERVGPQASLFMAELLVWSAMCEIQKSQEHCILLDSREVHNSERIWMAFLATKRDTYVLPAANCLGYMNNVRQDAGVDPNRDFPYSREDSNCLLSSTSRLFHSIMRLNLIQIVVTFHGGMVALGYEWGSKNHESPNDASPDDIANSQIGSRMVSFAGSFKNAKHYPVGKINSLVYPVDGGMEDWMYAAGWDTDQLKACGPGYPLDSQIADAGDKGNKAGNRAIVYLVETSDLKKPLDDSLGGNKRPLDPLSEQSGHVTRNARLALLAVDVAAPYLCFESAIFGQSVSVNATEVSQTSRTLGSEIQGISTPQRHASESEKTLTVHWHVGGAVAVDYTLLSLHIPPPQFASNESTSLQEAPWSSILDHLQPPLIDRSRTHRSRVLQANNKTDVLSDSATTSASSSSSSSNRDDKKEFPLFPIELSTLMSGEARWGGHNPHRPQVFSTTLSIGVLRSASIKDGEEDATFKEKRKISTNANKAKTINLPPGTYWIVSWAQVDKAWGKSDQGAGSKIPESYLVNARTSSKWQSVQMNKLKEKRLRTSDPKGSSSSREEYRRVEPRVVNGREMWPSDPLILEVTSEGEIILQSTVFKCAWWTREESESEEYKARNREGKKNAVSAGQGFGVPTPVTPNPDPHGQGTNWDFSRRSRKQWFALRIFLVCGVILAVVNCVYFRSSSRRRRGDPVLYQSLRSSESQDAVVRTRD